MRIAQVVLPEASEYERKSQRIDQAALAARHEVTFVTLGEVRASGAEVAHIYAGTELPRGPFVGFPIPYVANATFAKTRWSWHKPAEPGYVVSPFEVPESVDDSYFDPEPARGNVHKVIGTFLRPAVRNLVDQTLHRLQRTRDDITWRVFDRPPSPVDLMAVDIWVDPAGSEMDYDGFTAEALVAGLPVVATRTKINVQRLEKGRTGLLVPMNDPNEMTHAILSALFRPEVASSKVTAARQTASKFRAKQRLRVLVPMYETLIR